MEQEMELSQIVKDHNLDLDLVGFEVNDWGSCQYSGALDFFNVMCAMEEKYGRTTALKKMGIELNAEPEEVVERGVEYFIDNEKEDCWKVIVKDENTIKQIKKTCKSTRYNSAEKEIKFLKDDIDWYKEKIKSLDEIEVEDSLDCLFEWTKNQAWDLWSAAPVVVPFGFNELDIDGIQTAPGVGPELNIMAQSGNYETGFYCWLAWSYKLVKSQESFAGYDT